MTTRQAHDYRCASMRRDSTASACDCYRYQTYSGHTQIIPTSPDSLAQIAESLKPVGEFFEALRDGRVFLNRHTQTGDFRIDVISPKGETNVRNSNR